MKEVIDMQSTEKQIEKTKNQCVELSETELNAVQKITLDYYNKNGNLFAQGVDNVNFSQMQGRFVSKLPEHAKILDLGCGSGRDSLAFLNAGLDVEAIDGSQTMCDIASAKTGIPVRHLRFEELDAIDRYDGIWACASLLHLPKAKLPDVFLKIIHALKENGFFYSSFKYGEFEGYRNERYFSDFTEDSMSQLLDNFPQLELLESWISTDVRPGRKEQKWLNIIMRKKTS